MARSLMLAGAEVCIASRTPAQLEATAAFLAEQSGREPLTVATDITSSAECDRLIEATVERFGRLDIMVNNAGIGDSCPTPARSPYGEAPASVSPLSAPTAPAAANVER